MRNFDKFQKRIDLFRMNVLRNIKMKSLGLEIPTESQPVRRV